MLKQSTNKDLSSLNTFGMKVRAASYIEFTEPSDLLDIDWDSLRQPVLFLGEGSNLLFTSDFDGTVIRSRIKGIKVQEDLCCGDDVFVRAGSGESMDEFCRQTALKGWWGAENLSGIPGTVGAAPVQNVGAYGVEAADIVESVECFDIVERRIVTLGKEDCKFAYRDSFFKHNRGRYLVLSVLFHLRSDFRPQLEYAHLQEEVERNAELAFATADPYNPLYGMKTSPQMPVTPTLVRDTVRILRENKLPSPAKVGSAGSFFKNPVVDEDRFKAIADTVKSEKGDDAKLPYYDLGNGTFKIPAAFLIEYCGFKGAVQGGAAVWEKQPLVIVNAQGKAAPQDVIALENRIVDGVKTKFNIVLTAEVDHI